MAAASQSTQNPYGDSDNEMELNETDEREKRREKNAITYDAPKFDYPQNFLP